MNLQKAQRSWEAVHLTLAVVVLSSNICAQGNFVYTNDDRNPNTVSGFSVASDGTLTAIRGAPFAIPGHGGGQRAFAPTRISIAGNFLFASNTQSSNVSVFKINPSTGVLSLVPGSSFPTGGAGVSGGIAVSPTPDGRFLMVGD